MSALVLVRNVGMCCQAPEAGRAMKRGYYLSPFCDGSTRVSSSLGTPARPYDASELVTVPLTNLNRERESHFLKVGVKMSIISPPQLSQNAFFRADTFLCRYVE